MGNSSILKIEIISLYFYEDNVFIKLYIVNKQSFVSKSRADNEIKGQAGR